MSYAMEIQRMIGEIRRESYELKFFKHKKRKLGAMFASSLWLTKLMQIEAKVIRLVESSLMSGPVRLWKVNFVLSINIIIIIITYIYIYMETPLQSSCIKWWKFKPFLKVETGIFVHVSFGVIHGAGLEHSPNAYLMPTRWNVQKKW